MPATGFCESALTAFCGPMTLCASSIDLATMAIPKIISPKEYPVATWSLIVFNCVLWVGLLGSDQRDVFAEYALSPTNAGLKQMFTSTFLHNHWMHLAQNMFILWLFGRKVERALGSVEFLLFYIGSGFAASILHLAIVFAFLPPEARSHYAVGASGAIAGVLGVYAIRFYRDKFTLIIPTIKGGKFGTAFLQTPASFVLLAWLMLQVSLGITSLYMNEIEIGFIKISLGSVGYWAHLGGFIFGMGFAQVSQLGLQAQKEYLISDAHDSLRRGTLQDVARDFEELIECDPDDPFGYAELGRTYALLGEHGQSIRFYEKAVRLYMSEERTDLAVERFREMRTHFPDALIDVKLHFKMGCKLDEVGLYEEAIEVLNHIALAEPRTVEAEMSALRVAEIHLSRLNRPDFAIRAFNRFLRDWPDSYWKSFAEGLLAKAKEKAGERPEA